MRKRFWLVGVLVLLAAVVQAEELAIAGAWTNATGVLRFFGRGIGQEALPTARFFLCMSLARTPRFRRAEAVSPRTSAG